MPVDIRVTVAGESVTDVLAQLDAAREKLSASPGSPAPAPASTPEAAVVHPAEPAVPAPEPTPVEPAAAPTPWTPAP